MDNEDFEDETPECPACGGQGGVLGQLGRLLHFCCRQCGINFHHDMSEEEGIDLNEVRQASTKDR